MQHTDILAVLGKPSETSKKARATVRASWLAMGVALAVCALLGYQVAHAQVPDWSGAGIFAALVISAVCAPTGVQVHAQARIDREVLTEIAKGEAK